MAQPLTRVQSNRAQELENVAAPVNAQKPSVFVRRSTDVLKTSNVVTASNAVTATRRMALGDATNRSSAVNTAPPVKGKENVGVRRAPLTKSRVVPAATATAAAAPAPAPAPAPARRPSVTEDSIVPVLGKRAHAQVGTSHAPIASKARVSGPPPSEVDAPVARLRRQTTDIKPASTSTKEAAPPPVARKTALRDISLNTLDTRPAMTTKLDFEKIEFKKQDTQSLREQSIKIPRTKQEVARAIADLTPKRPIPVSLMDVEAATRYEAEVDKKRPVHQEVAQWDDIDKEDKDPLMVSEYVTDIFKYMLELEGKTMPDPNYMENQKHLAWKMRYVLIDWMSEVHYKFRLLPETLYLAVNLMDRFLSSRTVAAAKFQLVGVTALFVASKYEEVMAPSIYNFAYMADEGFKDYEILSAERFMLQALDFQICYPSPMNFLRRISKADNYDIHSRTVAKYLMEVPLMDHAFLECPPSVLAAASMCLARRMIGNFEWEEGMVHYSGYTQEQLLPWMERIIVVVRRSRTESFIYQKYSTKLFMRASIFVREWILHLEKN